MQTLTRARYNLIKKLYDNHPNKILSNKNGTIDTDRETAFYAAVNDCICKTKLYKDTLAHIQRLDEEYSYKADVINLVKMAMPVIDTLHTFITSSTVQNNLTFVDAPLNACIIKPGYTKDTYKLGIVKNVFNSPDVFTAMVEYFLPNYTLDMDKQNYIFNNASIIKKDGWNFTLTPVKTME